MLSFSRTLRMFLALCAFLAGTCVDAQTVFANPSFETPARSFGQYANPTNSGWTFAGSAGIQSMIGSPTGSLHGVHYAYLAGSANSANRGRVSQIINFTTPGNYHLRFLAGGTGSISVSVGGVVVDAIKPRYISASTTESWWSQSFTITTSGSYEIAFQQTSTIGNESAFVDNVHVASPGGDIANASFETFDASGVPSGWTVSNTVARSAGTSRGVSGSAWLSMNAGGFAITTVNVPMTATYSLSYRAAGSGSCGLTLIDVTGGGSVVLATLPFSTQSTVTGNSAYTSSSFTLPAGARRLRISSPCAQTLDSVLLNRAGPSFANANFETPALPAPIDAYETPWLGNPVGASWSFSGAEAGIQATSGSQGSVLEPNAEVGLQFGRIRAAGSTIAQTVNLEPGVYLLAVQVAVGELQVSINGALLPVSVRAGNWLFERTTSAFDVAQAGAYTFTFAAGSGGKVAFDLPRIVRLSDLGVPNASLSLRVNGTTAVSPVLPGGTLEATATASDSDGLQRLRVLRNGVPACAREHGNAACERGVAVDGYGFAIVCRQLHLHC